MTTAFYGNRQPRVPESTSWRKLYTILVDRIEGNIPSPCSCERCHVSRDRLIVDSHHNVIDEIHRACCEATFRTEHRNHKTARTAHTTSKKKTEKAKIKVKKES